MLHNGSRARGSAKAKSAPASQPTQILERQAEVQSLLASQARRGSVRVLLATAWITVGVAGGRSVMVRALLDQGSEMTFISENLAQLLRAKRHRMPTSVSAVGCVHAGTFRYAARIQISPLDARTPVLSTTALIMKSLTSYASKPVSLVASYSHLADLSWADPDPTSSQPISIIIGADLYSEIIRDGIRKGEPGQPIAQNSIFGWVISGPVGSVSSTRDELLNHGALRRASQISVHHCMNSSSLEKEIRRFWEVEELPPLSIRSPEDDRCENHFRSTHSRLSDGRYIVRLPFKNDPPIDIGESRLPVEKQLHSLVSRLNSNPQKFSEYKTFLREYEQLGHMRKALPLASTSEQCVYIPHHPVFRADSATTHLRVVFNASSTTSNGTSLNDHLLSGPKLQQDLISIIIKWRQFQYVYVADIAKMYRQILVDSRDINYQRILMKSAQHDSVNEYQLLTVTYGMACAPYLALRVIQQLATDDGSPYPLAISVLRDHIYVDDVLFGHDDPSVLRDTRDQLVSLLRRGGFELRKWASNSPALLSDIEAANHGLSCSKSLPADERINILGIWWNPGLDSFQVKVSLGDNAPESKRSILASIARFYDPLGWVTPVIVAAKIMIQQLWREKIKWDDVIPEPLLLRWKRIYFGLSHLNQLKINRWTGFTATSATAELHGFADASNVAYAAAVYLKTVSSSGKVTVTLIASKSRVAPLTNVSIPRLELLGAVLLSRLMELIRSTLSTDPIPCFCWTDSTIVIAWLSQHPSRWKLFVSNRVADIQRRLPGITWRHVATEDNPADCASRGLFGHELVSHPLWWHGPPWLQLSRHQWPKDQTRVSSDAPLEERVISLTASQPVHDWDLANKYSSWPKLLRVTSYIIKFVSLCRRVKPADQITESTGFAFSALNYEAATIFWLKRIQMDLFLGEIQLLKMNRSLPTRSSILALRPFLDRDGLMRVGGRLKRAPVPFLTKHPVLLASHPLVTLIVENAHQRALHAGLQLTLSTLRREYWILRARNIAKTVIHHCVTCTRERAAVPSQLMGDLPSVRVTAPARSFLHCGLDYAGPVSIRVSSGRGIKSRKAYIALFICLATRAIHLELVSDYSTPAFLNAYSRFCARRGLPLSIYSDNGTTFVGADRALEAAYKSALRDPNFHSRTAADKVTWHFIPPSAPHFGGIWEAGVRSVKYHLRRVLGNNMLTFEEFTTLLCKVEACLNSRPLAPLSDSLDDYEALTPGHFLIGSAITASPEPSLLQINENRLSRWQLLRHITERFWKLWYSDYVNTLQQRNKWRKIRPSVRKGQLVLLRNPALPPCKWELGRITHCHQGSDDLTRVVTVKTANSEYRRPIGKLCVLPVECDATPSK